MLDKRYLQFQSLHLMSRLRVLLDPSPMSLIAEQEQFPIKSRLIPWVIKLVQNMIAAAPLYLYCEAVSGNNDSTIFVLQQRFGLKKSSLFSKFLFGCELYDKPRKLLVKFRFKSVGRQVEVIVLCWKCPNICWSYINDDHYSIVHQYNVHTCSN